MADKGKQPAVPGEWVTIAKKAKTQGTSTQPKPNPVYVVFSGRNPGFYDNWNQCFMQVNKFPGACHQKFNSMPEAITAWENWMKQLGPPNMIYQFSKLQTKESLLDMETYDFYNPGIPCVLYTHLNEAWKANLLDKRKDFRKHLSTLAYKIAEQTATLDKFKSLSLKILKGLNYENEDFSLEKIDTFLEFSELLEHDFPKKKFNTIRRICLFEKEKILLPRPLFQIEIIPKIEDHEQKIKSLLLKYFEHGLNYSDNMPKLHFVTEEGYPPWDIEPIE